MDPSIKCTCGHVASVATVPPPPPATEKPTETPYKIDPVWNPYSTHQDVMFCCIGIPITIIWIMLGWLLMLDLSRAALFLYANLKSGSYNMQEDAQVVMIMCLKSIIFLILLCGSYEVYFRIRNYKYSVLEASNLRRQCNQIVARIEEEHPEAKTIHIHRGSHVIHMYMDENGWTKVSEEGSVDKYEKSV